MERWRGKVVEGQGCCTIGEEAFAPCHDGSRDLTLAKVVQEALMRDGGECLRYVKEENRHHLALAPLILDALDEVEYCVSGSLAGSRSEVVFRYQVDLLC